MKNLSEMNDEELGKLFPIILEEHNPLWKALYESEKESILSVDFTKIIVNIHHYGSTSIPNIMAKPTIDILVEIADNSNLKELKNLFEGIGYTYIHYESDLVPHMMFIKGYTQNGFVGQIYHVHIRYSGKQDELYFRDYLISNPKIAKEYEKLKLELKEKYEFDRNGYTSAKTEFINIVTKMAKEFA